MNKFTLALLTALGLAAFAAPSASAADFGFTINVGNTRPIFAPAPRVERQWVPGYYETRTEQILVSPERHEKVWVPAVYRTVRHRDHYHQELVTPGYYKDVCLPAQYQTVTSRVWVPGRYTEVVISNGHDHHHHDHDRRDYRNDRRDRRNDHRNERNFTVAGYR